jgi:hypothetical protein
MKSPLPLLVACLFVLGLRSTTAAVIIVDRAGGGDYTEIQPAIDAAQEGDVILVRSGSYLAFILDKGVIVRGFSGNFKVDDVSSSIVVQSVGALAKAGISGMTVVGGWNSSTKLLVRDCPGEVILESIYINAPSSKNSYLGISNCANVSVTTFGEASGTGIPLIAGITTSSVRMTDVQIEGSNAFFDPTHPHNGGVGLSAASSFVVLAHPRIFGGAGSGAGSCIVPAGDGGNAVNASDSTLIIVGSEGDVIRGGVGGDSDACYVGGDGGDGLAISSGSALVSRVRLEAGPGGDGIPKGKDGQAYTGNVVRDDRLPFLLASSGASPGKILGVTIDSVVSGALILLAAGQGGFETIAAIGPPLSALPGQWFFVLPAGAIQAGLPLTLSLPIPDDPVVQGLSVNLQAVILSSPSDLFLTNAVTRVIGG